MRDGGKLRKTLAWLTGLLTAIICAGLAAAGIVLYVRGTAAVQTQAAETVFTRDQAVQALRLFVIPALLLLLLLIASALSGWKDTKNELDGKRTAADVPERVCASRGMSAKGYGLILLAACGLIAAGVLNGGLMDVLIKAINICTECIGLG